MNAVGIDVSKGKSMVAALRPMGEVALPPKEFLHTEAGLEQMAHAILALGDDTRVVMEATGRYHEPVAVALHECGIYVAILNPLLIKQSGGGSIRKVKTDKADAVKIAKYGLDNWTDLREYTPMDTIRQQLKLCSRQYDLYMKTVIALQNNLISLTDKTFPGVNELFSSPERKDGHEKWVDFVMTFWHCDCVCRMSEKSFTERYQKWCKRKGYHFSAKKASELYASSCGQFTTLPKNANAKLLITTAAQQLLAGKETLAAIRTEMTRLAKQLPEYEIVLAMYGVGETTAAQLMAEIGDVRRFPRRSSIVGFAGIDPGVDESGKHSAKSVPTTKRGSPHLRKTLFQIVCTYLKKSPANEPVYQFLDKKRAEGKPYFVYMTAAQNKFLRIYYARVKECMEAFEAAEPPQA
jgi:transposase